MDGERPESALDNVTRLNLLNIVLERSRALNKKALIHRVVIVGRLVPTMRSQQELADYFDQLIKQFAGHLQVEAVSGLLLIYPNHYVHVVEGPDQVLMEVIQSLVDVEKKAHLVSGSKILICVNDVPTRLFCLWNYRILNISSVRMDESKLQEPIENKVMDSLTLLMKLGQELAKVPKLQQKGVLDQLSVKHADLLLPSDLIESLLKAKELLSPADYFKKYTQPVDVTLDGELVWPVSGKPEML